jgi:hypothetical protein
MLSIHTLAGASYQLLDDLGKGQGITSTLRSKDIIRPERMKEWLSALSRTQNFIKHADRDANQTHEYVEEGTIFLLFETVEIAGRLLGIQTREMIAFAFWFLFSFSNLVQPTYLEAIKTVANENVVDPSDRDLWHQWLSNP